VGAGAGWRVAQVSGTTPWPDRIYLQRHDDCVQEGCDGMHEGTTWCADKIHSGDVEYIRADLVPELRAIAERAKFGEREG